MTCLIQGSSISSDGRRALFEYIKAAGMYRLLECSVSVHFQAETLIASKDHVRSGRISGLARGALRYLGKLSSYKSMLQDSQAVFDYLLSKLEAGITKSHWPRFPPDRTTDNFYNYDLAYMNFLPLVA